MIVIVCMFNAEEAILCGDFGQGEAFICVFCGCVSLGFGGLALVRTIQDFEIGDLAVWKFSPNRPCFSQKRAPGGSAGADRPERKGEEGRKPPPRPQEAPSCPLLPSFLPLPVIRGRWRETAFPSLFRPAPRFSDSQAKG